MRIEFWIYGKDITVIIMRDIEVHHTLRLYLMIQVVILILIQVQTLQQVIIHHFQVHGCNNDLNMSALYIADNYPNSTIFEPCTVTDGERYSYLTGGYDNITLQTSRAFQIYDEIEDGWTVLSSMNQDRLQFK